LAVEEVGPINHIMKQISLRLLESSKSLPGDFSSMCILLYEKCSSLFFKIEVHFTEGTVTAKQMQNNISCNDLLYEERSLSK
jgi:hypothetical protein